MAKEFKLCIFKNTTLVYELFIHDDGKRMEQQVYRTAHIDEGTEVVDMLNQASTYYRKIVADEYEITRLPIEDRPQEFIIEMKRGGNLFRAYKWHTDNTFEATVLESDVDLEDFQENNRLNKLVSITMRQWRFDKFELTRIA